MMTHHELIVFSGNANRSLANAICKHLQMPLGEAEVEHYPDGEISVRLDDDVRGGDVFLVQPTCPPVNENLMELLVMIDAARRASAQRITAVMPYYGYARKDRKEEGRVPITAKLVANLLVTAGVNRVLALDLHATQIQGFFDIPVDHLYAMPVVTRHFAERGFVDGKVVFAAPDVGRIKMARAFAERLDAQLAVVDKRRTGPDQTKASFVIGDVDGCDVILVDDMITTGGSVAGAAKALFDKGARRVRVYATHGILCGQATERLQEAGLDEVFVTDSVCIDGRVDEFGGRLTVLSVAALLGEAISRIHNNQSVSALFS